MDTPERSSSHQRKSPFQMAAASPSGLSSSQSSRPRANPTTTERNTPYLPTPTEIALLSLYPILLIFGALFSSLSPETRSAPYDALRHAHAQDADLAPSYFARKNNLFNVLFVKRGWAWISVAFFVFLFTHPATRDSVRRGRAVVRWGVVTVWWIFVTQWFFGPAIIDRGFRWSGGKCEVAEIKIGLGEASGKEVLTSTACKAAGGRWSGGHDISGHVFLLVLGSFFLVQEVGWVAARWSRYLREERSVVMNDGAIKGAGVEDLAKREGEQEKEGLGLGVLDALGRGGTLAAAVAGLSVWMLLMTAIYFHTWFEKLTGLLVAMTGLYTTYILPRIMASTFQGSRLSIRLSPYQRFLFNNAQTTNDLIEAIPTASRSPTFHPPNNFATKPTDSPINTMARNQHAMPPIKAPANLPELVRTAFQKARTNGDLLYYPTQVALLDVNSVPFQLRFSPSLASKPKGPPPTTKQDASTLSPNANTNPRRPAFDPFDKPQSGLLISQLPPSHFLVLNKFAIVPEHFILATTEWREQTHLLEKEDLAATLACIGGYHAYHTSGKGNEGREQSYGELFAFFNSGEHSGASQPHRHIQLLPVERMRDGLEDVAVTAGGDDGEGTRNKWDVLANKLVDGADGGTMRQFQLPFKTFAERIHPGITAEELHAVYLKLYRRACAAVFRTSQAEDDAQYEQQTEGEAKISYNMAMTRDVLVIMPRLAEGAVIASSGTAEGESIIGKLALNGTVLAGTALVKSQAEWDFLRARPEVVVDLLGRIGVPACQEKSKV
ncbi:inositol phospholipid synthesis protein Scs3p [Naviculisporaceae sp. PSN 640]